MVRDEEPRNGEPWEEEPEELRNREVPPDWAGVPELLERGWRPYVRRKPNGRRYITLKRGSRERSLGPYTEERWELITSMHKAQLQEGSGEKGGRRTRDLFAMEIVRPPILPLKFSPSIDTIYYYKLLQEHGYEKGFGDFINEVVKAYFLRMGIKPGMIISVKENEEEE